MGKINQALLALDKMKNLEVQTFKQGDRKGDRKLSEDKRDEIARAMAEATTPSEVGNLAAQFGIAPERIVGYGKKAPNFGQFRMTMGNLIRGATTRLSDALQMFKDKKVSKELTIEQCGDRDEYKNALSAIRIKPVKAEKKDAPKKAEKKAAGKKPVLSGRPMGGAKSKAEQAKDGTRKGGKSAVKIAKRTAPKAADGDVEGDGADAGVPEAVGAA